MSILPDGIGEPGLIWLLAAGFLPILLHILDRRRARVVDWPAMRFLVPRDRSRLRRIKLLEALLILLRSLAMLLIAYALLKPFSRVESSVRTRAPGSRGVVLVIDDSQSMDYRAQGKRSALENAREAALDLLEDLIPGDRAHVLTTADLASGVAAARDLPALETGGARRKAADVRTGAGRFRILEALDRAAELSALLDTDAREIHLLTDLQASTFPEADSTRIRFVGERLRAARAASATQIVDCGDPGARNVFISALEAGALAVGTDETVELRARVESSGAPPAGLANVRLFVGDVEVAAVAVPFDGAGRANASFTCRLDAPGAARITARLAPDGLAADDARRLALEVLDRIRVLVVGTTVTDEGPGSARNVDLALAPRARDLTAPPVIFRPVFARGLAGAEISASRVVIITGLPSLDRESAEALERFVRAGGGLLLFAGEAVDSATLDRELYRGGRGILPARLGSRSPRAAGGSRAEEMHPRDVLTSHPALEVFGAPEEGDLSRITVHRVTPVREVRPDAAILARLGEDSPWIIEGRAGSGKVIVVTTSASPDDSDLPLTPLFLPLLHRLVRHLAAPEASSRALELGDVLKLELPPAGSAEAGAEAHVIDPEGTRREASWTLEEGRAAAVFGDTRAPGFYEMRASAGAGTDTTGLYAVNVPAEESRLERIPEAALEALRDGTGAGVTRDARELSRSMGKTLVERPHWPLAAAIAALLLMAELALARRMSGERIPRRGRATPKEATAVAGGRLS
ncbi:MAG TPA: BatA domain-containing protein [Planctomycetota bacterium]|nr:BatA domain-containing protein [Planctomycetota bacterium]